MAKKTNCFSHDSNARNDTKVIALRMKHGAAGYGVYFMLLERLREEADYKSETDYTSISFDLSVDAELVRSVVEDFGLFKLSDDGKYFHSESFDARMQARDRIREKRSEAGKKGGAPKGNSNAQRRGERSDAKQNNQVVSIDKEVDVERKEIERPKPVAKTPPAPNPEVIRQRQEAKKEDFYNSLIPFVQVYGKEMIREFFDYWTEPNKSKTKWRYELERTWDTSRRLGTWAKKSGMYNRNHYGTDSGTNSQQARAERANEAANLVRELLNENVDG